MNKKQIEQLDRMIRKGMKEIFGEDAEVIMGRFPPMEPPQVFIKVTKLEAAKRRVEYLKKERMMFQEEMPRLVTKILTEGPCCGDPMHRTNPAHPKDWDPIDNKMWWMFHLYHEAVKDLIENSQCLINELLLKTEQDQSDDVNDAMRAAATMVSALGFIFEGHFQQIGHMSRKKADAEKHYATILHFVEDHAMPGIVKVCEERLREAEENLKEVERSGQEESRAED